MSTFLTVGTEDTGGQKACEEDGGGTEHDGQIFVQVDSRQVPHPAQRNPRDDSDAGHAAHQGGSTAYAPGHDAQQEQAEHTAGEDARQRPPCVDDALDAEHGDGHDDAQHADNDTGEAQHEHMMALGGMAGERLHIVGQDDRGGRGDAGAHRAHAGGEDAGNEQAAQAHGQPVHDEIGEDVVGLGLNLGGQRCHAGLIVAVERAANEEEEGRDGDEQPAAEEG